MAGHEVEESPFRDDAITYRFAHHDISLVAHVAGRLTAFDGQTAVLPNRRDRALIRAMLQDAIAELDEFERARG